MLTFLTLIAAAATPAVAQSCPKVTGWDKPERHLAARSPEMKFGLKPGSVYQISLLSPRDVKMTGGSRPAKGYAGLAALDVPTTGTLDIGLDNKTYVDLIRDGQKVKLAGHGHECRGLAKALSFPVKPGRYLVQLSGPQRMVKMAASLR